MINWRNYTELEVVEALASWENMIDSEEMLSEKFDEYMEEALSNSSTCNCSYGEDEPQLNEDFGAWTDGLCKDGEIHSTQYSAYTYVGKWS